MATLLSSQAPVPLQDLGVSVVNRVGVAPDAIGNPMLCYAGGQKQLALLGGVPGARRWYEWDCLALPANRTNVLLIETVGRVEEATDEYVALRNEMLAAPRQYAHLYPPTPEGEPEPLRHQVDAFCFALGAFERGFRGFGQFSQQGCGKSRWACDLLRVKVERSAVVISQNSTLLQWRDWLQRICPEFEVRMLTGISVKARAALIDEVACGHQMFSQPVCFVVNWEVLSRLQDAFVRLKPDMVIADEGTRIKERKAQMSKAAHRISEAARYRVIMTGTPLGNDPGDLFSLYKFIEPSIFGKSYWNFMRQFFLLGGFSGNDFTGFNPLQIANLISSMYAPAYRITKSTIQDLPPKNYETIKIEMSSEQASLYKQVKYDLYAKRVREDGSVEALTVASTLAQITRLQQITAGHFPINSENGERARCVPIQSAKTDWLQSYCKEMMDTEDAQIVIWARFTAEIDGICRALEAVGLQRGSAYAVIDGRVKTTDRHIALNRFNDRNDSLRTMICQLQAASFGLDIPQADIMLYHSNSYSYLERAQSEERGHRMGRTRPYQIIDLACRGTVDMDILAALKKKASLADMLLVEGFGDSSAHDAGALTI